MKKYANLFLGIIIQKRNYCPMFGVRRKKKKKKPVTTSTLPTDIY